MDKMNYLRSIRQMVRQIVKPSFSAIAPQVTSPDVFSAETGLGSEETQSYWSTHNVTLHHNFRTLEDSLDYFEWRNDQYYGYIELMPVNGQDGKSVLDYGCGPGHDLVGFGTFSKPSRLVGLDVSPVSLAEAEARLKIHGINAELTLLNPSANKLPFEDSTFDYIHSSGVIHHAPDPEAILAELYRVLKPGGSGRVMIYNRNSILFHLYVAYQKMIVENAYAGLDLEAAFTKSTDGENCPISRCYLPEQFLKLLTTAGFKAKYTGASVSAYEAHIFNSSRHIAILERRLPTECRKFLKELTVDQRGLPVYRGTYAGVDACFIIEKK